MLKLISKLLAANLKTIADIIGIVISTKFYNYGNETKKNQYLNKQL